LSEHARRRLAINCLISRAIGRNHISKRDKLAGVSGSGSERYRHNLLRYFEI
jgi:hypothetical protein